MANPLKFDLTSTDENVKNVSDSWTDTNKVASVGFFIYAKEGIRVSSKAAMTIETKDDGSNMYITSSGANVIAIANKGIDLDCDQNNIKVEGKVPAMIGDKIDKANDAIGGVQFTVAEGCVHIMKHNVTNIPQDFSSAGCTLKAEGKISGNGTSKTKAKGKSFAVVGSSIEFDDDRIIAPNNWNSVVDPSKTVYEGLRANYADTTFLLPTAMKKVPNAVTSTGAATSVFFESKKVALKDNTNLVMSDSKSCYVKIV